MVQYTRLSALEQTWFPVVSLGGDMLHLFQVQMDRHENVFLTGEEVVAGELDSLNFQMMNALDELESLVITNPSLPLALADLDGLKSDYELLLERAESIDDWMAEGQDLSPEIQRQVQLHGLLQQDLLERFTSINDLLSSSFIEEIQRNKAKSLHATYFLGGLFMLVILCVTLITEKMADRLLIKPLTAIKDNIRRFAMSHDVVEPDALNPADEVEMLASAFWEMTRDLKTTTVSKKYVENIIRNMSGALVVVGPDGLIRKVNEQALALFAYTEDELVGQKATILFDDQCDSPLHDVSSLHNWSFRNVEVECRRRDNLVFQAHFSGSTMDNESGEVVGLVCVLNDITEMKKAEDKLRQMALYDALTGLANRHLFFDRLALAAREASRGNTRFALLFLDLDKFKPVNDTLGHEIGDLVLKDVAARLQKLVRSADTVSRMGGDEFTIILTGIKGVSAVERVAATIIKSIGVPFTYDDVSCKLGVSIGISLFPDHGEDASMLINKADQSMYTAKNEGRNTFCFYTDMPHDERGVITT